MYGIVAGHSFKPGHTDEERQCFADIEQWQPQHFSAGPFEYRWVNENYRSIDYAPFIGWSTGLGEGYLVATGFNAWGISNGTAVGGRTDCRGRGDYGNRRVKCSGCCGWTTSE